jgi:hypothetical protein
VRDSVSILAVHHARACGAVFPCPQSDHSKEHPLNEH